MNAAPCKWAMIEIPEDCSLLIEAHRFGNWRGEGGGSVSSVQFSSRRLSATNTIGHRSNRKYYVVNEITSARERSSSKVVGIVDDVVIDEDGDANLIAYRAILDRRRLGRTIGENVTQPVARSSFPLLSLFFLSSKSTPDLDSFSPPSCFFFPPFSFGERVRPLSRWWCCRG